MIIILFPLKIIVICFSTVRDLLHHFTYAANSLIRTAHLDRAKSAAITETLALFAKVTVMYDFLQIYSSSSLVRIEYQAEFSSFVHVF